MSSANLTGGYRQVPQREVCQVEYEGCLETPEVRLFCKTEGTSRLACHLCYHEWHRLVALRPEFVYRCPSCANHDYDFAQRPSSPNARPLLPGLAAEAINAAMHAEGLLVDIRQKVLQRLYQTSFWLAYSKPLEPSTTLSANTTAGQKSVMTAGSS